MTVTMEMYFHLWLASRRYHALGGFRELSLPWDASPEAIAVTLPKDRVAFSLGEQLLVGSAEQSFIDLMLQGQLRKGRWFALTPCFRNEIYDDLHFPYFMKLELISYQPEDPQKELLEMVRLAYEFLENDFSSGESLPISTVETSEGFDIEIGGIEVGSYGIRTHGEHLWVYGTGLAEPRYSIAVGRLGARFGGIDGS